MVFINTKDANHMDRSFAALMYASDAGLEEIDDLRLWKLFTFGTDHDSN